ncbi:3-oxoacyl-[acyl-carrier-protein] synthase 3 protein 1 [bioreactor metagenome]|uniref:3-oxoacyl-[acyl-carrier-protein] synthase 3 protein 1 n=1 Tax=bioreactor metagenome TaxID=1076179 RepID=A0A645EHK9_9ZZZZ
MSNSVYDLLKKQRMNKKDITWLIPHQANLRIINAVGERVGISPEKIVVTINKYGNTTAATIPTAISELYEERKLRTGDNIVMTAFGGGFTWGATLLKWNPYIA